MENSDLIVLRIICTLAFWYGVYRISKFYIQKEIQRQIKEAMLGGGCANAKEGQKTPDADLNTQTQSKAKST